MADGYKEMQCPPGQLCGGIACNYSNFMNFALVHFNSQSPFCTFCKFMAEKWVNSIIIDWEISTYCCSGVSTSIASSILFSWFFFVFFVWLDFGLTHSTFSIGTGLLFKIYHNGRYLKNNKTQNILHKNSFVKIVC